MTQIQAYQMVQEIQIFTEEYKDRPQLVVAIIAAFSMLFSVICLSCVAVGSMTILLGCFGAAEHKPEPPPERPKLKVVGGRPKLKSSP